MAGDYDDRLRAKLAHTHFLREACEVVEIYGRERYVAALGAARESLGERLDEVEQRARTILVQTGQGVAPPPARRLVARHPVGVPMPIAARL